jgi:hypothetical protein
MIDLGASFQLRKNRSIVLHQVWGRYRIGAHEDATCHMLLEPIYISLTLNVLFKPIVVTDLFWFGCHH